MAIMYLCFWDQSEVQIKFLAPSLKNLTGAEFRDATVRTGTAVLCRKQEIHLRADRLISVQPSRVTLPSKDTPSRLRPSKDAALELGHSS